MRAKNLVSIGVLASALVQPVCAQANDVDPWAKHRSLKVLYAGKEGGHREKVFGQFLEKHFDKSGTLPLEKLSMETAREFDVVIVDWMSQYGCDGYPKRERSLYSAPANLSASFTKPMIAMTYVGTQIRRGHKLDWL